MWCATALQCASLRQFAPVENAKWRKWNMGLRQCASCASLYIDWQLVTGADHFCVSSAAGQPIKVWLILRQSFDWLALVFTEWDDLARLSHVRVPLFVCIRNVSAAVLQSAGDDVVALFALIVLVRVDGEHAVADPGFEYALGLS